MDVKEFKNQIPFIIENGIVFNIKDIQKILKDLGHVHYFDYVKDYLRSDGEGYIVSVVVNNSSANIIANKRLYLNVNGFEYLQIVTSVDETVTFDLVDGEHVLRLIPLNTTIPEEFSHEMNSAMGLYEEEMREEEEEELGWLEDENEEA